MKINNEDIVTDIIEQVISGQLLPGDKLPTELELIATYNVSKMTVRKAFERLKALEVIESKERLGTFIKKKNPNSTNTNDFTLGYSMTAILKGYTPKNKILNFELIKAEKHIAKLLNINEGDLVYFIKRIRFLNDLPSAIEITYITQSDLPTLTYKDAEKSIYEKLYQDKKSLITNVDSHIEAIIPSVDLKEKLMLKEGEAVFLITQVSKITENNNFEYVLSFQAGSRINI